MENWSPTLEELESYIPNKKDLICHAASKKEILRGKRLKPKTGFVKTHKKLLMKAVRNRLFTPAEERMLFKLIPFCNIESNIITDEEGVQMTQKDIIKLVGMDKSNVIAIMKSLMEKQVLSKISKGKSVCYRFNKEWVGN